MPTFFEAFLSGIDAARDAARSGVIRATAFYQRVSPQVQALITEAGKLKESDAKTVVYNRFRSLVDSATTNASASFRSVMSASTQFVNGMPSQLSLRVYQFTHIQIGADAKGALGLPEIVTCDRTIHELSERHKADPTIDLTTALALIDDLLEKAGNAVDAFDGSEQSVNRLLITADSVLRDLRRINGEHSRNLGSYMDTIKDAQAPAASAPSVEDFATTLGTARELARAGNFTAAAVAISSWSPSATALLDRLSAESTQFKRLADSPRLKEGLLNLHARPALDRIKADPKLDALFKAAFTAVRARPYDIKVADEAVDHLLLLLR